jgi:hypothetical protein
MSESAPERTGGGGNTFTKKIGPLPMWGWMAIIGVLAVLYSYYKKSKSSSTSGGVSTSAAGSANAPGGVDASLVPQFINQTYNQETPPPAPNVTVNNTIPTPPTVTAPTPTPQPAPVAKAATISGSPGSYTTGLAGGLNEWTSTGQYSLNTVAKSHGMTPQQLIAVSEGAENNVPLQNYVKAGNYNAPLPSGVEIFIPNANWKTT